MAHQNSEFRSIATLMLQRIIALSLVCLVGIGGFQVWLDRQKQEKQFFNTMSLIVETSSRAIAYAVWDIDREVLHNHVQRLTEIEAVGFVRLTLTVTGEMITAGSTGIGKDVPSYQAVIYSPDYKNQSLGTIEVWADRAYHRNLLWESQKHVIPGYLIFTVLMCFMVAWVMQHDLGIPLRQIADFVRNLKPEELNQPLELRRPDRQRADEIDMVMQGFQHLQTALDRHIKDLDGLVKERTAELSTMVDEVKRLSQLDALTGAYNRRAMEMRLPLEIERCMRYGRPLSVIFTDIDRFKHINDQHGHTVGDEVLKDVAKRLQEGLRANIDWMVRFGGEEFVIFMPETALRSATEIAERLADVVRKTPWQMGDLVLPLTCSFGVTQYEPGDTMDSLLERADELLYKAKRDGRDCVRASLGSEAESSANYVS
ncbi:GGDEF domain-containing protein [Comamonas jiangduensis]|uniref:GGDEF domain-containing protein n=1 Tax=Comamonas jiangduensis TaxID=1194168 RepID=UPI0024E159CE|nr:diguanylate cyclase [Comamonas jiangduensis]